jgi:hypothetical protein
MAVPYYTYLKLKMNGIIMVSGSFEQAYACGCEHIELATTITNSAELQKLRQMVADGAPNSNKLTSSSTFCPTEDTKAIGVDPNDLTKTMRIRAQLPAK